MISFYFCNSTCIDYLLHNYNKIFLFHYALERREIDTCVCEGDFTMSKSINHSLGGMVSLLWGNENCEHRQEHDFTIAFNVNGASYTYIYLYYFSPLGHKAFKDRTKYNDGSNLDQQSHSTRIHQFLRNGSVGALSIIALVTKPSKTQNKIQWWLQLRSTIAFNKNSSIS